MTVLLIGFVELLEVEVVYSIYDVSIVFVVLDSLGTFHYPLPAKGVVRNLIIFGLVHKFLLFVLFKNLNERIALIVYNKIMSPGVGYKGCSFI